MKLSFVHNSYKPWEIGGAERSLYFRAIELVRRGHDVRVFTISPDGYSRTADVDGVMVSYIGVPWSDASPYWTGRSLRKRIMWHWQPEISGKLIRSEAFAELRRFAPDVVNVVNLPGIGSGVLQFLKKHALHVVQTVADYYYICARLTMFRKEQCRQVCYSCQFATRTRRRRASHSVDAFIFISNFMRERFHSLNALPRSVPSYVIPNSYPFPHELTRGNVSTSRPLRIGFIGRLLPEKGIRELLRAFEQVTTPCELFIAGEGEAAFTASVRRIASRVKNRVHFLGWQRPGDFYASIDLVVVPSLWGEPLSRVPFEANAHGVPALVSNYGGIQELIQEGENGFVFDPKREHQFAERLESFASNPGKVRNLSKSAFYYAKARFSPTHVAEAYESVFAQVAEWKQTTKC